MCRLKPVVFQFSQLKARTNDPQALKNSVLRAISGGPIYVSDKLGESQADMLRPLTLSDGRILRTDRPAVPTWNA